MSEKPNPGSDAAIALGCTCPVIDNHYGRGVPYRGPNYGASFWRADNCPLHGLGDSPKGDVG